MKKIKNILKKYQLLYFMYNFVISSLLKFISLFIKIDDKLLLFNSFGGAKFDDSPRVIYEYMKSNDKYKDYKMIWSIDNIKLLPKDVAYVKNNTIKFFITSLKSKYWITNSSMERGLKFKRKNTIYINTWHGSAIKLMGNDMNDLKTNYNVSKPNYFYAQSKYDVDTFSKAYDLNPSIIPIVGLPRNDELVNVKKEDIIDIKNKLHLPLNKKIILYAPTFREYNRDSNGCVLAPPINLKLWEEKLGKDYILLFRAHYEVNKVLGIKENDFIKNYSDYNNLNELLKISDILISDYSSIMIDYSILERPIFNYIYDFEEYKEKRGMYFDIREKLPNNCKENEIELLDRIVNMNYKEECEKTKKFKNEFVQVCGNARKYIDEIILKGDK